MKISGLVILIALACFSCGKDPSGIPDVPVHFHMSLAYPSMQKLNTPGGSVEIDGYGVAGLIIYRSAFSGYMAYDRCSSVNPEQKCAVKVDESGLTATDPCSKGVFALEDGNPQKLPAKMPLKRYTVSVSNNTIYVVN